MKATLDIDNHSHSTFKEGKKHTWKAKRLWELSKDLPQFEYEVSSFDEFDQNYWFCNRIEPTLRNVLEHYNRIQNAKLDYPIILSEDGIIMDGIHRILKAHLRGLKTIKAVKFDKNPTPDSIE